MENIVATLFNVFLFLLNKITTLFITMQETMKKNN
jgi:hypothetical protein